MTDEGQDVVTGSEQPEEGVDGDQAEAGEEQGAEEGEDQGVGGEAADIGFIAFTDGAGDDRRRPDAEALAERTDHERDREGEANGGQLEGTEAADVDGVDEVERHEAVDAESHRQGQPE